jgi:hypothetical protein
MRIVISHFIILIHYLISLDYEGSYDIVESFKETKHYLDINGTINDFKVFFVVVIINATFIIQIS